MAHIIEHQTDRHRFLLHHAGEQAQLVYSEQSGVLTVLHTEVSAPIEHQGIGAELATAALDDARARHLVVVPECPFVAAYIRSHPEYADLLA